jgi:hypothetical protein
MKSIADDADDDDAGSYVTLLYNHNHHQVMVTYHHPTTTTSTITTTLYLLHLPVDAAIPLSYSGVVFELIVASALSSINTSESSLPSHSISCNPLYMIPMRGFMTFYHQR